MKRAELRKKQIQSFIGRKYGDSVIIAFTGKLKNVSHNKKSSVYLLRCGCGNLFEKAVNHLRHKADCGCKTKSRRSQRRGSYLPHGIASFNELYSSYKNRAKYTNKEFTLTKEEFKKLTSSKCYYCGVEPSQKLKQSRIVEEDGFYIYNGIDRIDSSVGYVYGNCVSCCEICNKAKRDLSMETFKIWIKRLVNYYRDGV